MKLRWKIFLVAAVLSAITRAYRDHESQAQPATDPPAIATPAGQK